MPSSQSLGTSKNRGLITSKAPISLWGSLFLENEPMALRGAQGQVMTYPTGAGWRVLNSDVLSCPQFFGPFLGSHGLAICPACCWLSPRVSPPLSGDGLQNCSNGPDEVCAAQMTPHRFHSHQPSSCPRDVCWGNTALLWDQNIPSLPPTPPSQASPDLGPWGPT